jgi:hypothetical protein
MGNLILDANWKVHWKMTESAGLMVYLGDYRDRRVLWEASLPYITVDHQPAEIAPDQDTELHGPFWAPLGRRSQVGEVRVNQLRNGFELAVDFAASPFRYTQLWRFHNDGRLAPWLTIHPGGLHDAHTYHPHWRFDFDVDGASDDAIEHWHDGRWQRVAEEGWIPYTGTAAPDGAVWRQVDFGSGACVSIRPHHWEDAELYALRYHHGEWSPFYPRSGAGALPFPAAYIGAEPIDGQDVTLWYVAHVHYDMAFPFTAGPWITVEGT